jgi:hypothetical protein
MRHVSSLLLMRVPFPKEASGTRKLGFSGRKRWALSARAHPHPHAGGRGDGRRAAGRAGGIGLREARYATELGRADLSSSATARRAGRLRVGIPVQWPPADVPGSWRARKWHAIRRPASHKRWTPPPPAPRASPSARRRAWRRTARCVAPDLAAGGELREARYGHPIPATSAIRQFIPRRSRATGLQAHRCVVVGVPVKWPLRRSRGHGV